MSTTIMRIAGDELDRIAQQIRHTEGINNYAMALKAAGERNPELLRRYNTGAVSEAKDYQLSRIDRAMVALQADPDKVRFLAGIILDQGAKRLAAGKNSKELSAKNYSANVVRLSRENPSLCAAYDNGYIAANDFRLLGILIPEIAGEITRKYGIQPRLGSQIPGKDRRQYSAQSTGQECRRYEYIPDFVRERMS